MKVNEIYQAFVRLFPEWEESVLSYERVGSRMINITFEKGGNLYFLYTNDEDWNFGTKPYRRRPNPNYKNIQEISESLMKGIKDGLMTIDVDGKEVK